MALRLTITDGTGLTVNNQPVRITVGASGAQGPAGQGVPTGGTTGQILAKVSATNYDTTWITNSGGGGGGTAGTLDYQSSKVTSPARLDGTRLVLPGTMGNFASTPSTTALQITGAIEMVSRIQFTDWTRELNGPIITKRRFDYGTDSYAFALFSGLLTARWRDSASNFRQAFSTAVPFADGEIGWVKATIVPNNGLGGYTVSFYTATDAGSNTEPSSWTTRGVTTTTVNAGTILTNTVPLEFGSERLGTDVSIAQPAETSYVYRSIVRSGVGGTVVCDATFNAAAGATSFTESSTNAATVTITQGRRPASTQQVVTGDDERLEDTRFSKWNRYTFSNADYTIFSDANSLVVQSGTLNAPRTVTLPSTATFTAGQEIILWSGAGVSATNTLTLDGSGAETINGAATFVITEPNRMFRLVCNSTTSPHWVLGTSAAALHAAQHGTAGADPVSLDASQIATGTVATARLGSGTADGFHFLAGDSTWVDAVPLDIAVKNTSAATIAKGVPVYATGTVGATSVIEIAPADSASSATMSAIGLTTASLAVNATGYVRVIGVLSGVNTAAYTVNGAAYVASGGGLTPTRPTGATTLVQNIGRATRVNGSTGEILILGPGRTNDVPNLIGTNFLASSGTASSATYLRGDQSWSTPPTVATDTLWDAVGDLAVGSGTDIAARLAKGTRTQALVVGASTLEWDENHYNGGSFMSLTETSPVAETIPGGGSYGTVTVTATSGTVHLHGIYLPKGVTITNIAFVSGAGATTPTNQWFALCDQNRTVLRVTTNDATTAWGGSFKKRLALTSTFTTTYSGLHYLACAVTATTMPTFRGVNSGTVTGIVTRSFLSTAGATTPVAEGTTFAASTAGISQILGIVS